LDASARASFRASSFSSSATRPSASASRSLNLEVKWSDLELLERIGGGSFGDVFRAKWKQTPVAAKCLHAVSPSLDQSGDGALNAVTTGVQQQAHAEALADFKLETGILRDLRHPNICLLLGFSMEVGREVMISELAQCSLLDLLRAASAKQQPIPRRRCLRYLVELGRGMRYLHDCDPPVIHRDLKPANLLLDASNSVRISDFGLATLRQAQKQQLPQPHVPTQPPPPAGEDGGGDGGDGEFLDLTGRTGSYRFMAPEVFLDKPYGRPVDVYSFALIAYNLLENRAPFAGNKGLEAARAASKGMRPPIPRSYDERLRQLLRTSWAEEPKDRPSFAGLLDMLKAFPEGDIEPAPDATANAKGCACAVS